MDAMGEQMIAVGARVTLRLSHRNGVVRSLNLHTFRLAGGGMASVRSALVELDCDGRITEVWCPLDSLAAGAQS